MTESMNNIGRMTVTELHARLRQGGRIVVLDVRRREAWSADPGRVPGAIWLPLEEVPQRVRNLPQDTQLVLYCS